MCSGSGHTVWLEDPLHLLRSAQFSSVAQSCQTLCNPWTAAHFPVHHQLPELSQTHAHQVGDAIHRFSAFWLRSGASSEGLHISEELAALASQSISLLSASPSPYRPTFCSLGGGVGGKLNYNSLCISKYVLA